MLLEKLNQLSGITSFMSEGGAKFETLEEYPPEVIYYFVRWLPLLIHWPVALL